MSDSYYRTNVRLCHVLFAATQSEYTVPIVIKINHSNVQVSIYL